MPQALANFGIGTLARSRTCKDTRASGSWEFASARVRGDATDFSWHDRRERATGSPVQGWLRAGPLLVPVALGRFGVRANKREGDGGTPCGRFRAVRLWWRADRLPRPRTSLPLRRIGPAEAWCEDP